MTRAELIESPPYIQYDVVDWLDAMVCSDFRAASHHTRDYDIAHISHQMELVNKLRLYLNAQNESD